MARRSGHAKKIDTVHWTGISVSALALAAGGVAGVAASAAQHLPETILRIRGEWGGWLDGLQGSSVGASITAGLILVPEGTSTTVLWSPDTDADAPWIWWDTAVVVNEETVTDAIAAQQVLSVRRVVDSKAMRKVRNRELQFVVENISFSGTPAINCVLGARVLAGS